MTEISDRSVYQEAEDVNSWELSARTSELIRLERKVRNGLSDCRTVSFGSRGAMLDFVKKDLREMEDIVKILQESHPTSRECRMWTQKVKDYTTLATYIEFTCPSAVAEERQELIVQGSSLDTSRRVETSTGIKKPEGTSIKNLLVFGGLTVASMWMGYYYTFLY